MKDAVSSQSRAVEKGDTKDLCYSWNSVLACLPFPVFKTCTLLNSGSKKVLLVMLFKLTSVRLAHTYMLSYEAFHTAIAFKFYV